MKTIYRGNPGKIMFANELKLQDLIIILLFCHKTFLKYNVE